MSPRAYSLIPTRANGQPAFGSYGRGPDGVRHATGVFVLTLAGDQISALARFESSVLVRAAEVASAPVAGRAGLEPLPGAEVAADHLERADERVALGLGQ